jgi:two-component system cell cycle response regulator DivK
LVIEDNPANMKLASLLLSNAGHTALCAVDAETGLTLARAEKPDLILMDIQLPGMDGLAATALLKADPATAAIPILALTAMAMLTTGRPGPPAATRIAAAALPGLYAAIDGLGRSRPCRSG